MHVVSEQLFQHCPRCGAPDLTRPEPAAYQCSACGFFYHINPAVGVGGIVQEPSGRIILLRRANEPRKGFLGLPGGFVDAGETAEAALRREIFEEVGLEVQRLDFFMTAPNRYPYRGVVYNVLDIFYLCQAQSFAAAESRKEVAGIYLMHPQEVDLEQIAFSSVRQAIERFQARIKADPLNYRNQSYSNP